MLPVVAIVGRPNVGKSTLFNRLTGTRKALVHDRPGVTRDRNYETAAWMERTYLLVDTGGFDPEPEDTLYTAMRRQCQLAMEEADVILFLVDRVAGVTPADQRTAQLIRTAGKPVVVAVNKCDEITHDDEHHAFWELGFSEVVPISAEHNRGVFELMDAIMSFLPPEREPEPEPEGEIRVAVLGRPNVGKSTLLNQLSGEERHIVDNQPGTTVDPTDSVVEHNGTRYRLVDTAGIRRRARIDDRVEELAVSVAIRTIERCHVVLLVLDGTLTPGEQDARLAGLVEERGRAMIILVNKWDAVREMEDRDAKKVEEELRWRIPRVPWAPLLFISARTGKGTHRILELVKEIYDSFNRRISTARLNQFLRNAIATHSPPQRFNHPVRLNYMAQVRVRPPTFTIFCNTPEGIVESYDRYLQNQLREEFHFVGTPLRTVYRRKRRIGEPGSDTGSEMGEEE